MKNDDFKTALRQHIKQYVPIIFKSSNPNDQELTHESRLCQKLMFNVFDQFICNGDPNIVFKDLKKMEEPRVVCLKVFKLGEPTYSCRSVTCGMDPTCVLCVDCFQNSSHKLHKYKMSTSGGGGYCDCGDLEAWKADPLCDLHKLELEKAMKDEVCMCVNLTEEMKARLEALFYHLTYYCMQMLTMTHDFITLEDDLQPKENESIMESNKLITMLFNDEVHTYDQVTSALKQAISCSKHVAYDIATTVDREGRCVVKVGNMSECSRVKQVIEVGVGQINEFFPLSVHIMSPYVVAHQSFALRAIAWMKALFDDYSVLRTYFAELSMSKTKWCSTSLVEWSLMDETKMWKNARSQTRQLFMTGIFLNLNLKKRFAVIFAKVYDTIIQSYVKDDCDHSISVVSESIQLFTVPSLVIRFVVYLCGCCCRCYCCCRCSRCCYFYYY
uniref:E3 ubiquitin-protein ligase n=1 Tax=Helobdella robusta TaxID=6412 RepID=T1FY98_HELRO